MTRIRFELSEIDMERAREGTVIMVNGKVATVVEGVAEVDLDDDDIVDAICAQLNAEVVLPACTAGDGELGTRPDSRERRSE